MQIIDGRKIAADILSELKIEVEKLSFKPVFCDVLVGQDPVSVQYVGMKGDKAEKIGIKFLRADFPENISTQDLVLEIQKLNSAPDICGLIVQLPLPGHLDKKLVLDTINPEIDVDSTGEVNTKLFYEGKGELLFPTAAAAVKILDSLNLDLVNKKVLVLGQGELVGKPVTFLLKERGLNVSVADKFTSNPSELMKEADVIISATGKAGIVSGEKIKPGAVVVDAGTSEQNGSVVGDADRSSVEKVAGFLSPVPGGVGPVTVSMLLSNVVQVAKERQKKSNL